MNNGYVYVWTDNQTGKKYVGARKGYADDDDYICSSKPMMEVYKKRPDTFTREIVFKGTLEEVAAVEEEIQKIFIEKDTPRYNQKLVKYTGHLRNPIKTDAEELREIHKWWHDHKKKVAKAKNKTTLKAKDLYDEYIYLSKREISQICRECTTDSQLRRVLNKLNKQKKIEWKSRLARKTKSYGKFEG